jgi:hypothetical protein
MQKVAPAKWDPSVRIPLFRKEKRDYQIRRSSYMEKTMGPPHLFGLQKVTGVRHKHLFDAGVEDDRGHGTFVARLGPTPAAMGIGEIDLYPMDGFGFVFLFRLQDELLQNGVVACHDAK